MNITDIYETINSKTESFFEWVQAHPKIGLLFAAGLLALWFVGILLRVGVDATARGMKPPILTVAPSIPTAIVSTVCPTSASFALSASSVCSAVGGRWDERRYGGGDEVLRAKEDTNVGVRHRHNR